MVLAKNVRGIGDLLILQIANEVNESRERSCQPSAGINLPLENMYDGAPV